MNIINRFKKKEKITTPTSFVTSDEATITRNNVIGCYDPLSWITDIDHRVMVSKIGTSIHHSILEDALRMKTKNEFNLMELTKGYISIYAPNDKLISFLTKFTQSFINGSIRWKEDHLEGFLYSDKVFETYLSGGADIIYDEYDESVLFNSICKLLCSRSYVRSYHDDDKWIKSYESYLNAVSSTDRLVLLGFDSSDLSLMSSSNIKLDPKNFIFTVASYDANIINFASQSAFITPDSGKTFVMADLTYANLMYLKAKYDITNWSNDVGQIDRIIRFAGSVI